MLRQTESYFDALAFAGQVSLLPATDSFAARDVAPTWELLRRGVVVSDPKLRAVQERLQACAYGMAYPERDEVVPACVQHSVLGESENARLGMRLPLHPSGDGIAARSGGTTRR